ncbi:MAG TPA: Gfo/Idh/MocA family oxidoreductase, partial [Sphingobium sp.]
MRVGLVGAGAFGEKHLEGLNKIDGVEVATVVSVSLDEARKLADRFGVSDISDSYEETLKRSDIDAVILTTPTQMHACQAIQAMEAGKHVEVEIPVADTWGDALAVLKKQQETGVTCMVGHTRRFNPSHQYVHRLIEAGQLNIQQMDVQTYFFRRKNINAKGEP